MLLPYKQRKSIIEEMQEDIHLLLYVLENEHEHTESELTEGVNDWLGKAGLKLHKGKGLINYVADFTKGAGQMILAAVKGDRAKIKQIANSIEKEQVVDFLYKLDLATMHVVTGPIHFIDAVTGWDLMVNLKSHVTKAKGYVEAFKEAIKKVKETITSIASGTKKKRLLKHVAILDQSVA
jgi:hypothetical protein